MSIHLNPLDKVEILTLQDNYVNPMVMDNSAVIRRGHAVKEIGGNLSLSAEHGFASVITVTKGNQSRRILFDFGFSPAGAAINADLLDCDLSTVEAAVLSHGHLDHIGGLAELMKRVGNKEIDLFVHPAVLRNGRCHKAENGHKVSFPVYTKHGIESTGVKLLTTESPTTLLDGDILFLGEIPRSTDFEKGAPYLFYEENGQEKHDRVPDDTSIVMNVKGKGLVILSGCAHAGIINTITHARTVTGINDIVAVMGGFHLCVPNNDSLIAHTIEGFKKVAPSHVIPTHCTGRDAILLIEREMPGEFILNMVGTTLTFSV